MNPADWKDRNVCILGAGREGQAAYRWLLSECPDARLTLFAESAANPEFAASLRPHDRLLTEPISESRLREFDLLIRSPGISPYREPIAAALRHGVKLTTPTNLWFAANPDARTICVTGTKGKSTVSALIAHLLRSAGKQVNLAGNIGLPPLACKPGGVDWWVIELSSYQIADLEAVPEIAVLLNISPEHLDWHGDEATYRRDKLRLADLTAAGRIVANAQDEGLASYLHGRSNVTWFGRAPELHLVGDQIVDGSTALPLTLPRGMLGAHNRLNIAAALTAVRLAGLEVGRAARSVSSFEPLPHRLQSLGVRDGVTYVNDSIATTPVATVAALEALDGRPLVLIVGGYDRGLDWSAYMDSFKRRTPLAVIGIPANGPQIVSCLRTAGVQPPAGLHHAPDLKSAVALARSVMKPGDTLLLSPGAPSFPQFADFSERGRLFASLCGFDPA